jgi:acetamidase/formamidase
VGSTLYLPVQVAGALAYVGDPHFAQGDGEVALTAMEASLRVTLRLDVIAQETAVAQFGELAGPLAETSDLLVPTGLDADLDVATQNCVRAAIALLQARYGMDPAYAYAYLSAATDFDISQVVDLVKGVHARIRKADFA